MALGASSSCVIYVLGGRGFVGSAFVRCAQARGWPCVAITRENYGEYVGTVCDVLINADGNSRKYLAESDPGKDFELSVKSVADSLFDFRFHKYVYISSVVVYNDSTDHNRNHEEAPIDPLGLSAYGFHKYLAEMLVRRYSQDWLIVRLGGVVGENMWKGPVYDILSGRPLRVGHNSRFQFINTEDVARIVFRLIEFGRSREVFNVCGRGTMRLSDIQRLVGDSKPNDLPEETWDINTDKVNALVGLPTTEETIRVFESRCRLGDAGVDGPVMSFRQ